MRAQNVVLAGFAPVPGVPDGGAMHNFMRKDRIPLALCAPQLHIVAVR
jgi:hypothetical protein